MQMKSLTATGTSSIALAFSINAVVSGSFLSRFTQANNNISRHETITSRQKYPVICFAKVQGPNPIHCISDKLQSEQWHKFNDDIDSTLQGLVSPSPESFHVLHSAISDINQRILVGEERTSASSLNNMHALSSFLIKPNYAIEMYWHSGVLKWKLIPRVSERSFIYPHGFVFDKCQNEMFHEFNTLELSRLAVDLATEACNGESRDQIQDRVHELARQAEKRLKLTKGSDLRGTTSSDACFNFALAGIHLMPTLFQSLCHVGIHELKRTGSRASFQSKHVLHMVEKFAASDIQGERALKLYHVAGSCLENKGYGDLSVIEQLKTGSFGFSCQRPLVWLWRFSSRQRKQTVSSLSGLKSMDGRNIDWERIFCNTNESLIVDVGSGMGASLLNLCALNTEKSETTDITNEVGFNEDSVLQMPWSNCNYAGADLNQAMVNFGNGIVTRDTSKRNGRVHFFCLDAEEFLCQLHRYPGTVALVMINFPSPYQLESKGNGNSQLPPKHSGGFMVTKSLLQSISDLLSKSGGDGYFLFQTKCEDVAVHVKNECLTLDTLECVSCKYPVKNIELQYAKTCKRPKRVDKWLQEDSSVERAEGDFYSSRPLLPEAGQPETEAQCQLDKTVVHRCLFKLKKT